MAAYSFPDDEKYIRKYPEYRLDDVEKHYLFEAETLLIFIYFN